jgi:hypothetical protein
MKVDIHLSVLFLHKEKIIHLVNRKLVLKFTGEKAKLQEVELVEEF